MPLLFQEKINEHSSWALWQISEDPETLQQQIALSPGEQDELSRIQTEKRRQEWLASRIILKDLAREQQAGGHEPQLLKDEFGKPQLAGSAAKVSLTHSYPFAAAIIHTHKEVGIDIEHPREQLLRIQRKFLNPKEREDAGDDLQKLCVYWTAKEALYKLYGRRQLIFQEQILVSPFKLAESGKIQASLLVNGVKKEYNLHYRCFQGVHICFSL